MKVLEYPFDSEYILKKKKSIKKELLSNENANFIDKKIAILGGSTTNDIKLILELFLLNYGIRPTFYESEYNMYYEDAMFPNEELASFEPDLVYIHTTNRNILNYPELSDDAATIDAKLDAEYARYVVMWQSITDKYHCEIIQNNFEMPSFRLLGNMDTSDIHGRLNFIQRLNLKFSEYAASTPNFHINDINYVSAAYGLDEWQNDFYWHMYKYAMAVPAIPSLAFNIAKIVKSLYGKNKKAFVLDLDNTLWGGVVGDDGVDGIAIGNEVSMGQVYTEFQTYLKSHKDLGVLLNVNSKNDYENAIAGLNHPDGVLKPDDFIIIKANWENKDRNILEIANELNIMPDSLVFVDDNPAERAIVAGNVAGVSVPEVTSPENYIKIIDRSGFFEPTSISKDDAKRNEMYKENAKRAELMQTFTDYNDYLKSLEMVGTIKAFEPIYMARIAQLTNKSNQFNLTTRRYSEADIENFANDANYITLYGKLEDKFGDNGVVSVVVAGKDESDSSILNINLWLMSCRVLKRGMEDVMMDELVKTAKARGFKTIKGFYYPTAKNSMVKDFFDTMGYTKESEDSDGNKTYSLDISDDSYETRNKAIKVNE